MQSNTQNEQEELITKPFTNEQLNMIEKCIVDHANQIFSKRSVVSIKQLADGAERLIDKRYNDPKKDNSFYRPEIVRNTNLKSTIPQLIIELAERQDTLKELPMAGKYTSIDLYQQEMSVLAWAGEKNDALAVPDEITLEALKAHPFMSEEQKAAVVHVNSSDNAVSIYQGWAGAGKTETAKSITYSFQKRGYDIQGLALSWVAANVLKDSIKINDCCAIETFKIQETKAYQSRTTMFTKDTLLFVDEAGMVGTQHMFHILRAIRSAKEAGVNVKVVLTGDELQILPVNAGAIFKRLIENLGSAQITTIRRQKQASHRQMVKNAALGYSGYAMYTLLQQELIKWGANKKSTENLLVQDYLSHLLRYPNDTAIILSSTNASVVSLNQKVREGLKQIGRIGKEDFLIDIEDADRNVKKQQPFSIGDSVTVRKNFKDAVIYHISPSAKNFNKESYIPLKDKGVFNRTAGIIKSIQIAEDGRSYDIHIDLTDREGRIVLNTLAHRDGDCLPMHYNYAKSINASQGQTVDRTFLMFEPNMDFRLFYVGISRHKENMFFYINENAVTALLSGAKSKSKQRIQLEDQNGNEIEQQKGLFNRIEMLNYVSMICGQDKENYTIRDEIDLYERHIRDNRPSLTERAHVRPEPLSETLPPIDDYDHHSMVVVTQDDTIDARSREEWWERLYINQHVKFNTTDEEKIEINNEATSHSKKFQDFKNKILAINNQEADYEIQARNRLFTAPPRMPFETLDLKTLLKKADNEFEEGHFIPESERKITTFAQPAPHVFKKTPRARENLGIPSDILEPKMKFEEMNERVRISAPAYNMLSSFVRGRSIEDMLERNRQIAEEIYGVEEVVQDEPTFNIDHLPMIQPKQGDFYIDMNGDLAVRDGVQLIGGNKELLDFLNGEEIKGQYWVEGQDHQPRFLARDGGNEIKERYDEFGGVKMQFGYPAFMSILPIEEKQDVRILLVPGVGEYFGTFYNFLKCSILNNGDEEDLARLKKVPDVMLGSLESDYGLIFEEMSNKGVNRDLVIARGKEGKYNEWAIELRNKLWDVWQKKTNITPAFTPEEMAQNPNMIPPWENNMTDEIDYSNTQDVIRESANYKRNHRLG